MIINLLLAVPFNDDYKIAPEIKKQLTAHEFFEECFLKPAYDEYLDASLNNNDDQDDIISFDQDILKRDIRKNLEQQADEMEELEAWIISRQPDLYCLLGDAGAGKSTFLHYLEYKYKLKKVKFEIVDIQKATEDIKVLNYIIEVPEFYSLYAKSVAILIKHIIDSILIGDENVVDTRSSVAIINEVKKKFCEMFVDKFPRNEVEKFFDFPNCDPQEAFKSCRKFAEHIYDYMKNLLNNLDIKTVFSILLEVYISLLICKDKKYHYIIAFDNFERFIGEQEIYNKELTEFVDKLRGIQKSIANNNKHLLYHYQIMISMRHTSVRMFTSEQVTEFMPHIVDINQWFEPSSIIKKKIQWLEKHDVEMDGIKHIPTILHDMGGGGNALRGLHFKISMLFNYNKRVIVTFLVNTLYSNRFAKYQMLYVKKYDYFWNKENKLSKSLSKFAARSIIYRMILDRLRDDGFFQYIMVQEEKREASNSQVEKSRMIHSRNRLGFARKILTLLLNYDNLCQPEKVPSYMKLSELFKQLFPSAENPLTMLFDDNNKEVLDNVVQILFYMNYYSPRKKNWLQFIDIQYDISGVYSVLDRISIDDSSKLMELLRENLQNINIRITNAGKAYLYFVVYHFEYFACRNINAREDSLHPLLYTIPTLEEIKMSKPEDLDCIYIMQNVQRDALSCIEKMKADENIIYLIADGKQKVHSERIINSHRGYLDNFIQCIKSFYEEEMGVGDEQSEKINDLINAIIRIRDGYNVPVIKKDYRI